MSLATSQGRNFRWMTLTSFLSVVLTLIVGVQVARQFGVAWNGELATFNAVVFPVTFFGASWLSPSLVRDLNQKRDFLAEVLWTNTLIKFVLCSLLGLIAVLVGWVMDLPFASMAMLTSIVGANVLSSCGFAQAFDAFRCGALETAWRLTTRFIYLFLSLWFLFYWDIREEQIWLIPAAELVSVFFYVLGLGLIFHFSVRPIPFTYSWQRAKEQMRFGRPFIFSGLNEKLVGNLDVLLLRFFGGAQGAFWCGLYSVPQRVLRVLRQQLTLLMRQIKPEIVRSWPEDRDRSERVYQFGFHFIACLTFGMALLFSLNSKQIIWVLFSDQYVEAKWSFVFLSVALAFRHLTGVSHTLMLAAGMNKQISQNHYLFGAVALVSLFLGVFLARYEGVAFAMMFSYFFSAVLAFWRVRSFLSAQRRPYITRLLGPLVLSLSLILGLYFCFDLVMQHWNPNFARWPLEVGILLARLSLGVIILIFAYWFWGPFDGQHKAKIRQALTGFLGSKAQA